MNIFQAIGTCLSKTFTFKGRASRSEYWWYLLFLIILFVPFVPIVQALRLEALIFIVLQILIISVSVRRLHDMNRSGWWCLLLPILGFILWIWFMFPSYPDKNKYDID